MAVKITLPKRFAKSPVLAGIAFTDGVATVPKLGSSARAYFEHIGAALTDPDAPVELPPAEWTAAQLRDTLASLDVDAPSRATKPELVALYEQHSTARVDDAATADAEG